MFAERPERALLSMVVLRRIAALSALVSFAIAAPVAAASATDACAQRVIRDWYDGGRVDGVYPLSCYRAAIEALPSDVLAYSDADRDIARALAFARRGKRDEATPRFAPQRDAAPTGPAAGDKAETDRPQASPRPQKPSARPTEVPARVASAPTPVDVSAALPYPVIALAALAVTLLAAGAVGWLVARRH